MPQLSEAKRLHVVTEFKRLGSASAVARQLGVAPRTVRRWRTRFEQHGTMRNLKPPGRPRLLGAAARAVAFKKLLEQGAPTTSGVAAALHGAGLTTKLVSRSTVARAAKEHAKEMGTPIHCMRGLPKKALTQATMDARVNWARAHQKTNWARVMFTDRKRFEFKYPGVPVSRHKWVVKGKPHTAYKVNHAQGLNVYAGLTIHGLTSAIVVTGTSGHKTAYKNKKGVAARNITAQEYKDVMVKGLLPQGQQLFGSNGISVWEFQQDNDPTHRAGPSHVAAWNRRKGSCVQFMVWPPNSPDLSPIENVWSYVDGKVQALGCKSFVQFKEAVLRELKNVPLAMVKRLYASMPKRVACVLEEKGGKTKY
jgi:transposase-like protein